MSGIWQFFLVCPLVFLAGFVDAVAGGGGLISLPAYLLAGVPVHMAIGTNKLSSGMGTTLATVRYACSGYIPWKLAILCALTAYLGSTIGANLALLIADTTFKIILLIVIPLTALYLLRGRTLQETTDRQPLTPVQTALLGMTVALFIGMYDGFYGPGAGSFLILAFTGLARLPLRQANGVSKVINLTTNISALVVYLINGKVIFLLGFTAGLFSILGNYIGTRFFSSKGSKAVKPIMLLVLSVFFVKLLWELFL